MKAILYYLKDETDENKTNKKTMTIAVLQRGKEVARGVAICSDLDQFKYRGYMSGRHLALMRAMKALNEENVKGEIKRPDALKLMKSCGCEFCNHKIRYMPDLTDYEKKRLQDVKDIEEYGFETIEDYIDILTYDKICFVEHT